MSIFIVEQLYFYPDDGGNSFLQNMGIYLQNNVESDVANDHSLKQICKLCNRYSKYSDTKAKFLYMTLTFTGLLQ